MFSKKHTSFFLSPIFPLHFNFKNLRNYMKFLTSRGQGKKSFTITRELGSIPKTNQVFYSLLGMRSILQGNAEDMVLFPFLKLCIWQSGTLQQLLNRGDKCSTLKF